MSVTILTGDCIEMLRLYVADAEAHCCVTSPPYFGLRDYGHDGQIGLEPTPDEYVAKLVDVFREVRRALRDDGTLWLNLGDSYASGGRAGGGPYAAERRAWDGGMSGPRGRRSAPRGYKDRDLLGIPWRVAFALQADGWYLRSDIIWHKPNPMPESIRSRPTKSHEYVFLLSKSKRYYYDHESVKEPSTGRAPGNRTHKHTAAYEAGDGKARTKAGLVGYAHRMRERKGAPNGAAPDMRNRRTVWTVPTRGYKGAHFATFPPALIEPCVLAGCPHGGIVLDPFGGSGTTGVVAQRNDRRALLCEINPDYVALAEARLRDEVA